MLQYSIIALLPAFCNVISSTNLPESNCLPNEDEYLLVLPLHPDRKEAPIREVPDRAPPVVATNLAALMKATPNKGERVTIERRRRAWN